MDTKSDEQDLREKLEALANWLEDQASEGGSCQLLARDRHEIAYGLRCGKDSSNFSGERTMSRTLEFDLVKALIQRLPVDLSRASESLTKLRAVLVRGTIAAQDLERELDRIPNHGKSGKYTKRHLRKHGPAKDVNVRAEKRRRVRESRIRWRAILENAESAFRWWRP